jgi:hypothetical protein
MQASLDKFFDGVLSSQSVDADPIGNVIENRLGERIGALEDHAHAAAEFGDVIVVTVFTVEEDFACEAGAWDSLVDTV